MAEEPANHQQFREPTDKATHLGWLALLSTLVAAVAGLLLLIFEQRVLAIVLALFFGVVAILSAYGWAHASGWRWQRPIRRLPLRPPPDPAVVQAATEAAEAEQIKETLLVFYRADVAPAVERLIELTNKITEAAKESSEDLCEAVGHFLAAMALRDLRQVQWFVRATLEDREGLKQVLLEVATGATGEVEPLQRYLAKRHFEHQSKDDFQHAIADLHTSYRWAASLCLQVGLALGFSPEDRPWAKWSKADAEFTKGLRRTSAASNMKTLRERVEPHFQIDWSE